MAWVAGADGCKGGWFRVSRNLESGELRFDLVEQVRGLLLNAPRPSLLALDIPIGLPDAGRRDCDRRARQYLGPRRSSVFPAPIRPALQADTREAASRITRSRDGRKVGAQAWALYGKIREADELLQSSAEARRRIVEAHPEVCFCAWAGGRPMTAGKKRPGGRQERRKLVEAWLGPDVIGRARDGHLKKHLADDDILDAIAALWTATRIANDLASSLPALPPLDSTGLPMRIVY